MAKHLHIMAERKSDAVQGVRLQEPHQRPQRRALAGTCHAVQSRAYRDHRLPFSREDRPYAQPRPGRVYGKLGCLAGYQGTGFRPQPYHKRGDNLHPPVYRVQPVFSFSTCFRVSSPHPSSVRCMNSCTGNR